MKPSVFHTVVFILATLVSFPAFSQQFELGEVTKEELQEKFHPIDTAAPAAVLYEKAKTYFKYAGNWLVLTEVEMRIKIYKKDGYKYAMHKLLFYKGEADHNVFSDAYTYNLSGDAIVKTKLGPEGEFIESKNKYTDSKTIVLPDVREGSIIEYKYITVRNRRGYLPDWYFQTYIPVNHIEYNVALPAYFTYHSIVSGDVKINRTPQVTGLRDGFQENKVTYSASHVPALHDEPYLDNINNYRALVKHELAAITSLAGDKTEYVTSWKTFAKNLYLDDDFGEQLKIKGYFQKDIDALLNPGMITEEKMNVIFNYVQDRMVWNGYDGFFSDVGVKEAYKLKTGNIADINLMLTAMLKYAGLTADPVLTGTRDNGLPVYPSTEAFNYVLCGVQSGNNLILLDASGKYTTPGIIMESALNKVGRKVRADGSAIEVDLTPKKSAKTIYNVFAAISADGSVSGKVRSQYLDYKALELRESGVLKKQDEYISALENKFGGAELSDYTLKNEMPKPLTEEYNFHHKRLADLHGEKIIINPMLFLAQKGNPFTADKRHYPVDFSFSYQYRYMITLNLPEGYIVESYPEPASVVMGEDIANFKYNIDIKNNQIQLNVVFELNRPVIEKENYNSLKDFFRRTLEKQNEKIILNRYNKKP